MKLSTNLIGVNMFCTYWGYGKSEDVLHEDMIQEDFENGYTEVHPDYYYEHFDNQSYMEEWNRRVQNFLEEHITNALKNNLGAVFTYTNDGYRSPREYNFGGDVNNFTLEGDWFKVLKFCRQSEYFEEFLKREYSSYDGFISLTANNLQEWEEDIKDENETAYGAALSFFLAEGAEYFDDYFIADGLFKDMYFTEYVDYTALEEFKKELSSGEEVELDEEWKKAIVLKNDYVFAHKIAREEYNSLKTPQEIALEFFPQYEESFIVSQIESAWKAIENNTKTLEL